MLIDCCRTTLLVQVPHLRAREKTVHLLRQTHTPHIMCSTAPHTPIWCRGWCDPIAGWSVVFPLQSTFSYQDVEPFDVQLFCHHSIHSFNSASGASFLNSDQIFLTVSGVDILLQPAVESEL